MSRILIVGANGQLAFDLIRVLGDEHHLIKATHDDFDVADREACQRFVRECKPQVVINTAAFHKTLECESNPQRSFQVNAIGAYNVAKAAAEVNSNALFISTNYIFDGRKEFFGEDDVPNPLNVYGASKLAGEILTRIANPESYIIRTGGLFGRHRSGKGHNFVSLMLEKTRDKNPIEVVNDEFTSVTYTHDLATKIKELVDKDAPYGIYHLVNEGYCSWYEFAKKIFEICRIETNLVATSAKERESPIKRPEHSVLISSRLRELGIQNLRLWQDALVAYLREVGMYGH